MPGITGFWQVLGSSRVPLHEMVKIDYLYGAELVAVARPEDPLADRAARGGASGPVDLRVERKLVAACAVVDMTATAVARHDVTAAGTPNPQPGDLLTGGGALPGLCVRRSGLRATGPTRPVPHRALRALRKLYAGVTIQRSRFCSYIS